MFGQLEGNRSAGVGARGELIGKLVELLDDTKAYMANRKAYDAAKLRPFAFRRVDMEAMIPIVNGQLPLVLAVNQAASIEAALDIARDYKLRLDPVRRGRGVDGGGEDRRGRRAGHDRRHGQRPAQLHASSGPGRTTPHSCGRRASTSF